ncbi:MAG: fluoride efflux transporter CrcB [Anaerolineales bacterium]|nr:fluoride efflux transporter CrcB [Anaerolineales bacterium]
MPSLLTISLVALGGAAGSVSRYLLGVWIQSVSQSLGFPFGTLAVNLVGCFVIGLLSQLTESRGVFTPETRGLVFIGFLGGFTTFSSFGNDTMNLFRAGQTVNALVNVGANVILGLAFVWLGRAVAFWIWR